MLPPLQQERGRHRTEHEQGQSRHVERAVQRHAAGDARGRGIPQRVEGFADRGLLAQREQPCPQSRHERGGHAHPQQR